MSDTPRIIRSDTGGLCTLLLNRPEAYNALDTLAFEELDAHLAALEGATSSIGCVVIRGAGKGFCAGADLKAMGKAPVDPRFKPSVIDRLAALPQPVIAAVHGACFTGALELALACDFIIADRSAKFADTHGKWGLVGAWGMMQRLPRRVGTAMARRMMMTGETVDAETALAIGLADDMVDPGDLDQAIAELSSSIMANSWHTNFAIKRTLRETDGMRLNKALEHERANYPGNAPDHAERVAKFSK